jgi:hypothetical protein
MQFTIAFSANFHCELLQELPQPKGIRHLYFPGATSVGGTDGVLIQVEPMSHPAWIGTFAYGTLSPKGTSKVFSMPDPDCLCVVARGQGYIVPVAQPTEYQDVTFHPIMDVRVVPKQELIIFANFTELLAYDASGIRWRTKRLAWDSLKITDVTEATIRGEFWDIRSEQMSSFIVDLRTGDHQGGADFT